MKYVKKPVVIEAFRIGIDNIPDWAMNKITNNEIILKSPSCGTHGPFEHMEDTYCEVNTLEGIMIGHYGDYIIQGVNNEVYPCKPDIFEKTYSVYVPYNGENMNFGEALEALKQGKKVYRKGWNNPNIWLELQIPDANSKMTMPYIYMVKYDNKFPCDLSCESYFAEDWCVVD